LMAKVDERSWQWCVTHSTGQHGHLRTRVREFWPPKRCHLSGPRVAGRTWGRCLKSCEQVKLLASDRTGPSIH
jgi:hypothetical protein